MMILTVGQSSSHHLVIRLLSSQESRQQWRELRWDLMAIGEVELGATVVDMDEFWALEEPVGEFVSCDCS